MLGELAFLRSAPGSGRPLARGSEGAAAARARGALPSPGRWQKRPLCASDVKNAVRVRRCCSQRQRLPRICSSSRPSPRLWKPRRRAHRLRFCPLRAHGGYIWHSVHMEVLFGGVPARMEAAFDTRCAWSRILAGRRAGRSSRGQGAALTDRHASRAAAHPVAARPSKPVRAPLGESMGCTRPHKGRLRHIGQKDGALAA